MRQEAEDVGSFYPCRLSVLLSESASRASLLPRFVVGSITSACVLWRSLDMDVLTVVLCLESGLYRVDNMQ